MKKFYYITFVAAIAIACIQAFYIVDLYNGYKAEKITMIERLLALAIDDELHIRNLDPSPIDGRSVVSKTLEDMTPWELDSILKLPESRELDSLMRLNVSEPLDFMNIDKAREKKYRKNRGGSTLPTQPRPRLAERESSEYRHVEPHLRGYRPSNPRVQHRAIR